MQKKFLIGAGAFALAISGFLVTKANKTFAAVTSGVFKSGASSIGSISGLSGTNFTTSTAGKLVKMVQTNGANFTVIATLFTSAGGTAAKVYHH